MLIIPAIDIIEGKCVRLTKGDFNTQKLYYDNPVEVAKRWKSEGAKLLHIVDLDGARTGTVKNLEAAIEIRKKVDIKIQYGGGIRDIETLKKVFNSEIERAIIGTKAIEDKDFLGKAVQDFGDRFVCSVDFGKGGMVFKNGWQRKTKVNIFDFARELEGLGIKEIIVTDISRDGTLRGPNLEAIKNILKETNLKLIIAGGISSLQDILNIRKFERLGVSGIIIGKALYEGKISLKEAIKLGLDKA